jgi:hypothetical protein
LARITKLSWFDRQKEEFVFRKMTDEIKEFLKVRLVIQQSLDYTGTLKALWIFFLLR